MSSKATSLFFSSIPYCSYSCPHRMLRIISLSNPVFFPTCSNMDGSQVLMVLPPQDLMPLPPSLRSCLDYCNNNCNKLLLASFPASSHVSKNPHSIQLLDEASNIHFLLLSLYITRSRWGSCSLTLFSNSPNIYINYMNK